MDERTEERASRSGNLSVGEPTEGTVRAGPEERVAPASAADVMAVAFEALLLLDEAFQIVSANDAFYRTFELSREDVEGQPLLALADRRFDVPRLRRLLKGACENESGRSEAKEGFPLRNGLIVRAAASCLPRRGDNARIILLALDDITDLARATKRIRKEAESCKTTVEELWEHEERFRMLVETMNDGLAVRDVDGRVSYVNSKLCDMVGFTREEIIGRQVTEFLDEASQAAYAEQSARRQRGESARYDLLLTHKDGRKIYTIVSPRPVFDAAHRFKGSFAVVTDITERMATEAALQESERKLRLVSSHLLNSRERESERISRELHDELGQDLAVLKYQTRFLESRLRKDQKELKEACADTMQQLDAIMDNVRRIARDLSPSALRNLGLTASLRKLADDFAKQTGTKVALEIATIDALLSREAEVNVYRICQEALTNARKHAGATRLSISVTKKGDTLFARIADNGKGFDMLNTTVGDSGSCGLGLAIMQERARTIRGSLEIKSRGGEGTELFLRVPVVGKGGE